MHKSKLLNTLKLFSREEIYLLSDFLHSPYFMSEAHRRERLPLFQYIINYYGQWDHADLAKTVVLEKVYGGKKIAVGKFDKLMSALLKDIHQFIAVHFKEWKEDPLQDMVTLISFFRTRNAYKSVTHYLDKVKKQLANTKLQGKQYFFNDYMIGGELIHKYYLADDKHSDKLDYASIFQPLDTFYLLSKLERACFLLSLKRFRKPVDLLELVDFLDTVKPLYQRLGLLEIPLISIYYLVYDMLKAENVAEEDYWKLKELIEKHETTIPSESAKILNGLLRNFIIEQHNRGAKHLLQEIFNLHRMHLEKGYLNFEKGILPSVFKNIVTMGVRVKEYDWVYQFLNNYKNKIEGTTTPKDVYDYNLASYYFERQSYEEAMDLLRDQYEDIFYKIAAKRLELKILYEVHSDILDAKMDAFKIYVFRLPKKAILDHKRASNNHFIDFLRQLRNPKTAFSPKRIERLRQRVNDSQFITEKDWLLEKLAAL